MKIAFGICWSFLHEKMSRLSCAKTCEPKYLPTLPISATGTYRAWLLSKSQECHVISSWITHQANRTQHQISKESVFDRLKTPVCENLSPVHDPNDQTRCKYLLNWKKTGTITARRQCCLGLPCQHGGKSTWGLMECRPINKGFANLPVKTHAANNISITIVFITLCVLPKFAA